MTPDLASIWFMRAIQQTANTRKEPAQMVIYNTAINRLDMPRRLLKLPVDARGYPVPKFVEWIDGKPDFRVMNSRFLAIAVRMQLCWICGEPMGRHKAFVLGPMCAINRTSAEPPSHLDCARFAVKACPFLTQPKRIRNEEGLPEERAPMAGEPLLRNPGVALIWVTSDYQIFKTARGPLFGVGDPTMIEWYAFGRTATRNEIMASIGGGLPILQQMAEEEGAGAVAAFEKAVARGLALVPAQ